MALFRPDRTRRSVDPFLPHKMLLFAIGAGFAIAGIISGRDWLINTGIVVLLIGIVLRLWSARSGPEQ